MLFQTANEDSAMTASPTKFFASLLDDRSTAKSKLFSLLKLLLIVATIVAIPMLKDSLSHYLQHASAQALHIDETLTGIFLALVTKIPELGKVVRPSNEENFSFNYLTHDED